MRIILNASKDEEYLRKHGQELDDLQKTPNNSADGQLSKRTYKPVYISPEELEELRKTYQHVVVQDFEDSYHMTKEEREEQRRVYAKFYELKRNFTKKIRKLDKYIQAMRLCMEIIDDTAKSQNIYSEEEFKKKVLQKKIVINGLQFPKFQGKNKKKINWDFVSEFILDPEKPMRELADEFSDEEIHLVPEDLIDEETKKEMFREPTGEELKARHRVYTDISLADPDMAVYIDRKERKQLVKKIPEYISLVKNIRKDILRGKKDGTAVWELRESEARYIEEYDRRYKKKKGLLVPEFHGDASNQEEVDAFLYAMEEWELDNELVEYRGKYITKQEYKDTILRETLEENGWNVRNMYGNKQREKELEKRKNREKKRVDRLKKMLKVAEDKYKNRDYDGKPTTGKKKQKKKKGKAKKASDKFERIILDAVDPQEENMKEYQKKMERMEWGEE